MLNSYFKIACISSFLSFSGCGLISGESLFNASEYSMMGYKIGENISDIQSNNSYIFIFKDSKKSSYYIRKTDKKQINLQISVDTNNNIVDIRGSYQYDNLKACNNIVKKTYDNNIDVFPLKQRGDVNVKGYAIDGSYKNYRYYSFCGTASTGEVLHMSTYMDIKSL